MKLKSDLIRKGYGPQTAGTVAGGVTRGGITSFEELREKLKDPEWFYKIRNFGSKSLAILQKEYTSDFTEPVAGMSMKDFIKIEPVIAKQMFKIEGEDEYYRPSDYPEAAARAVALGVKLEVVYFTYKLVEEDK